jgi:hypothetical protein
MLHVLSFCGVLCDTRPRILQTALISTYSLSLQWKAQAGEGKAQGREKVFLLCSSVSVQLLLQPKVLLALLTSDCSPHSGDQ